MKKVFCDEIDRLYDLNHIGVIVKQRALSVGNLQKIKDILKTNTSSFYPLTFGNVTRWDLTEIDFVEFPELELCRKKFRHIMRKISSVTSINLEYQEKYSVMFYPENSSGIQPHRDSEHSVNCVGIFVISGNNPFFATEDTKSKNPVEFSTQPGDVILLRGPRSSNDGLSRPIHYVGEIKKSRYVMICRHINLDKLKNSGHK